MASLSTDANGNRTIQFTAADCKRRSLRLGKVPKKVAESVRLKVEALNAAVVARLPLDGETAAWVAGVGDDLAARLAAVGLVAARPASVTLSGLLDLYAREKERDNKVGTRTNHRTMAKDLLGFFKPEADPRTVTEESAAEFLKSLRDRGLAAATVARRLRRVRAVFALAVKKNLIPADPFADLKAVSVLPAERRHYVTPADAARVIAAASPVWRTVVALARFGGLRCPSEVLMLKWADVDFAAGRMTVPSCKTEHIPGKAYRACPIFAALRPHLDDAWELAGPGEVYVVGGPQGAAYRAAAQGPNGWVNANLRTEFERLIRRAGLQAWPRLFHNLRASCETDLLAEFPISAVTAWMGHSATVALKHYAQVRDEDFRRAAEGGAKSGAVAVQNPVQTGADAGGREKTQPPEVLPLEGFRRLESRPDRLSPDERMTLRGFEPRSQP